uniref:Sodium/calcium exchanger membrane region domain-containing protein n=1 Tax=Acanthochromis polyacanthus TaxID=80966 RepID=A0A3Q1GSS3_9TELE
MGRPMLGDHVKLEVIIEESYEFKNTVDKLIKKTNLALLVGTNSWRDQFIEAITVSADDDDEECGEEKLPSCFDYVMHFLTVFWKVLFAFVPPTEYWNGWACFVVSICMIGLLTAIIGDLASHFGCTVGLKDSVTAVVFVALGTSVPGCLFFCYIFQLSKHAHIYLFHSHHDITGKAQGISSNLTQKSTWAQQ